ncbi:hypothetical protein [Lysinibacillus telephonicus]|uniref:hypothetical protein n=1 Tax=Lysinibacillus telephonicus TaxID=1714840 RepID=UPI0037D4B65C
MQEKYTFKKETVKESDINYINFLESFVQSITHYFGQNSNQNDSFTENQMTHSLFLIEKIHFYLFSRHKLYKQIVSFPEEFHPFHHTKTDTLFQLLKGLDRLMHKYPFLDEENQIQCQNNLSQILNYYSHNTNSIKIKITSPLPKPWKPREQSNILNKEVKV